MYIPRVDRLEMARERRAEVFNLYSNGITVVQIAKLIGVNRQRVYQMLDKHKMEREPLVKCS